MTIIKYTKFRKETFFEMRYLKCRNKFVLHFQKEDLTISEQ